MPKPPNWWRTAGRAVLLLAFFTAALTLMTLSAGGKASGASLGPLRIILTVGVIGAAAKAMTRYPVPVVARAVIGAVLLAAVGAWFFYPGWLTTGVAAAILLADLLASIQPVMPFSHAAVIGLAFAVCYDTVQVYLTHRMVAFGTAGASSSLPILFTVPAHLSLRAAPAAFVGLGDIAIPGVLVVMAGRIGQRVQRPAFYWAAITGYTAGMLAAMTAGIWSAAVPATIFLIPGIVVAVLICARRTGTWAELSKPLVLPDTGPGDATGDSAMAGAGAV